MFTKKDDSGFIQALKGVKYKTLALGAAMHLLEFRLDKGADIPMHRHPHEQTGYLISGKMTFVIDGESFEALPGDAWNISGNIEHGVEVHEDAVVLEVFSPVREDYLR
jgi:quercetin dioxygenase-like cupin family protein